MRPALALLALAAAAVAGCGDSKPKLTVGDVAKRLPAGVDPKCTRDTPLQLQKASRSYGTTVTGLVSCYAPGGALITWTAVDDPPKYIAGLFGRTGIRSVPCGPGGGGARCVSYHGSFGAAKVDQRFSNAVIVSVVNGGHDAAAALAALTRWGRLR